jgi:NADPH2:quinone reductase
VNRACGFVEAVDSDVREVDACQRVADAGGPLGAYSEVRLIAAAMMLKDLTVGCLLRRNHTVAPGETTPVHAGAAVATAD